MEKGELLGKARTVQGMVIKIGAIMNKSKMIRLILLMVNGVFLNFLILLLIVK